MNLRHLRALSAIAEHGSMNAAAEAIGLSQPALAQGLAKLEAQLGARLFTRTASGMRATPEGELVIDRARAAQSRLALAMRGLPRAGRRAVGPAENRLTSTQIRALLSLAESGSFLGAARATGASQPALHRAVRDLEAVCGVALAERQGQRVALTAQGQWLARHFRIAGSELLAARQDLAADQGAGHIAVGAMPLCRARLLPRTIAAMVRRAPSFGVDVAEGSYVELIEPLRDGRIDIAIGALRDPCPPDLAQQPLFVDRLAVVARRNHPLARRDRVETADLASYPWIIGRQGSPLRGHWDQLFAAGRPEAPIECGSVMTIRGVLLDTDFLTLLSPDQIALEIGAGLLATIPILLPSATRTIGIIRRLDWRPTTLQGSFIALLAEVATGADVPETE